MLERPPEHELDQGHALGGAMRVPLRGLALMPAVATRWTTPEVDHHATSHHPFTYGRPLALADRARRHLGRHVGLCHAPVRRAVRLAEHRHGGEQLSRHR